MKEYPSIPGPPVHGAPNLRGWAFYKYDGSNLRVEWSKKRGWHKWGTRTRLFDHTDPVFGQAPKIFLEQFAEPLEKHGSGAPIPLMPTWLGNPDFHLSHKSNLIRKDRPYYEQRFGNVPDNLPYVWPSK